MGDLSELQWCQACRQKCVRSSGQLDSTFTASDGPLLCLLTEARTRLSSPINSAGFSLFVLCAASTDTSNLRVSAKLRGWAVTKIKNMCTQGPGDCYHYWKKWQINSFNGIMERLGIFVSALKNNQIKRNKAELNRFWRRFFWWLFLQVTSIHQ